jgi:hypothetical protein
VVYFGIYSLFFSMLGTRVVFNSPISERLNSSDNFCSAIPPLVVYFGIYSLFFSMLGTRVVFNSPISERLNSSDNFCSARFQKNKAPARTDMHKIARTFWDKADGKVIFPKTVEMLQKHYISWKFNQRLKALQLSVAKTVDSLSTAFVKQRATAPAIRTFKLPQEPCKLLNSMMEQKTNFVPPEQALPNSSFIPAKINVPEKWQAQTPKLFRTTLDFMSFNNPVIVDMISLAKAT